MKTTAATTIHVTSSHVGSGAMNVSYMPWPTSALVALSPSASTGVPSKNGHGENSMVNIAGRNATPTVNGMRRKITSARCANWANVGVPPSSARRSMGGPISSAPGRSMSRSRHTSTRSSAGHSRLRICGTRLSTISGRMTEPSTDASAMPTMMLPSASHGHLVNR